jgi:hypothetical protein
MSITVATVRTRTHRLAAAAVVLVSLTLTMTTGRASRLRRDSGDVPGWAIASGAACVLALAVYAAYSNVIDTWIGKITG